MILILPGDCIAQIITNKLCDSSEVFEEYLNKNINIITDELAHLCYPKTLYEDTKLFTGSIKYLKQRGLYTHLLDSLVRFATIENYNFKELFPFIKEAIDHGAQLSNQWKAKFIVENAIKYCKENDVDVQ